MNVLHLPPHAATRLIAKPGDRRVPTPFRTTDATTALTRGLAEYVAPLVIAVPGGRTLSFASSFDAWAQPEDEADYPSFIAYTNDTDGEYDKARLTPAVTNHRYPDGTYEVVGAELGVDVKCEVWATDPEARAALCLMVEEAFAPVEWMYGFRLELPHYFGQRATFEPGRITYLGDAPDALAGFWKARVIVRASVPVTRLLGYPLGQPTARVEVGNDVDVDSKS